jgi:signal transduction histidine kinase/CheY-like chemotaxis protein/HPt (histidine-containing phosphotransfer) domain-containing protein
LPGGNFAIGTVNGGMALVAPTGELLRILDTTDGLLSRAVFSIAPDATGYAWCATPDGIFRLEAGGHNTLFGPTNGLKGQGVIDLKAGNSGFYALTRDGVFGLIPSTTKGGRFAQLPQLTMLYNHLQPFRGGLLLARHGGVDFFDGTHVRPLFTLVAKTVLFAQPSRTSPDDFYLSEPPGLGRLVAQPDGSFIHTPFLELPDACTSLHEDANGRLWIGTEGKGAFAYDATAQHLTPVNNPATGEPFPGRVLVLGRDQDILFFHNGRVLMARTDGSGLRALEGVPALDFSVTQSIPGSQGTLVAFRRANATDGSVQGLGILAIDQTGKPDWRELDVPALRTVGSIRTMEFSEEAHRPILWIGGSEGLLRLDYDAIPAVKKPDAPLIRLDTGLSSQPVQAGDLSFPFQNHRLSFRVFTGDYAKGKDWLFQIRLGNGLGEWSASTQRRSYEFTNLSEGDYRFEVRAVNTAGLASAPSVFTFRILPPWYRSGWAYAGYAAVLALGVFGLIRVRERQIRIRNQELEALVEVRTAELVKASAAKDEFLAGVSHEIRNPMNGVIGIAESFKTEGLDLESRRKFSLLRQCASHLSSLLEDILDFSKVQAGAIELDPKPFDLPELVESITAITGPDSEKYGIPVEIAISPAVPRELVGDARRIRQILINFVSNALKFSGRGQVSVTVWCKSPSAGQTEVIFAVSDEGPGISVEEQQRLFTRFERGAAAQQGRVPGTGLGLALCKGLAEKMGGSIWLESELGRGSCFYFSAPFAAAATPAESPPATLTAVAGSARSALVVDDQEYNRIVLADLLQTLDFSVLTADEGQAALALAERQVFDVIFLDFNLPGLSGVDVARGIRALPNDSAHALILATTAFTTPEKRALCLNAGMDAFLSKPVTMEKLRKALTAATGPGATPVTARPRAPVEALGNLRLLARKKQVPFAEELALYFSELDVELEQLNAALQKEDAAGAGHYAHLLCGRCGFIQERELEQTLRKIEGVVANQQWADARFLSREFQIQLAGLRVRLASAAPVGPPA